MYAIYSVYIQYLYTITLPIELWKFARRRRVTRTFAFMFTMPRRCATLLAGVPDSAATIPFVDSIECIH